MVGSNSPVYIYTSILEPWTRLAMSSPAVVSLRLTLLPWLWLTEPDRASRETQRMFNEKQAAIQETALALTLAPMWFWADTLSACLNGMPQVAVSRAMINSSRRVARPSNRRVRDNRKRLNARRVNK